MNKIEKKYHLKNKVPKKVEEKILEIKNFVFLLGLVFIFLAALNVPAPRRGNPERTEIVSWGWLGLFLVYISSFKF